MTVTSIDINPAELKVARELVGAASNKETVDIALKTLIAIRRQPAVVNRIITRTFTDDELDSAANVPSGLSSPAA
ncbi:type II toxin-antitoxin system VapB family antitoxin [Subtercola endophyticus]|uniref:type II toxin-antitoxin system VapB family antitoxin n=1 Tax=Subtercola endophyticus TaxID=2895559 RepID=UPI001E64A5B4|nr:type II toxin-antitoxin system VapB family antitoxin [Subtercola endophyticus]UFS58527.1 type II toxin-antitoxin system VapB family antitoxin [Subtercola endophyticus]